MKMKAIILALALGTSTGLIAQDGNPPRDGQRPPPRNSGAGNEHGGNGPGQTETLTDAQRAQVKVILSKFDPNALTADKAKAIHEAFRQAGLRGGPAMADTIKAAGFNPDKLRALAPPPGEAGGGNERPRREVGPAQGSNGRPEPRGREAGGQGGYSIQQAVTDRAQLNTIAFDGLAFLTGDFGCNTFLPPGKVADF